MDDKAYKNLQKETSHTTGHILMYAEGTICFMEALCCLKNGPVIVQQLCDLVLCVTLMSWGCYERKMYHNCE